MVGTIIRYETNWDSNLYLRALENLKEPDEKRQLHGLVFGKEFFKVDVVSIKRFIDTGKCKVSGKVLSITPVDEEIPEETESGR